MKKLTTGLLTGVAASAMALGMAAPAAASEGYDALLAPGNHIPATEGSVHMNCEVPPDADDNVLIVIENVLDAEEATDKVRLATYEAAWVESHANDLDCGDQSSIGVFQQRPDFGWVNAGDPELATYDFLHGNPSDSTPGAIEVDAANPDYTAGQVAQTVQRSAYPDRYDEAEPIALELQARAQELTGEAAS
ncbi:hypothetical protein [Prauserella rugosa]|uniref:Secreted protein n=1 Tax=Prauserella rugosa TaxID=43354 RepID=A0A660C9I9_9PSEU|nr:hypothetical protein [Prauserella rugosa]KID30583.1 hypothetical protein HQ32_02086 [Prauserella sp. Am3]KMS82712.1 hypothetical protein ACZ91_57140 [Streptomyces regensis]TWH20122.1 hypothetical protein JD82_01962 [Prauserella rugosa]